MNIGASVLVLSISPKFSTGITVSNRGTSAKSTKHSKAPRSSPKRPPKREFSCFSTGKRKTAFRKLMITWKRISSSTNVITKQITFISADTIVCVT